MFGHPPQMVRLQINPNDPGYPQLATHIDVLKAMLAKIAGAGGVDLTGEEHALTIDPTKATREQFSTGIEMATEAFRGLGGFELKICLSPKGPTIMIPASSIVALLESVRIE